MLLPLQMVSYVEQTIGTNLLIDSDRESNKSDDSETAKQQNMYIWSPKYEVSELALSYSCVRVQAAVYNIRRIAKC